MLLTTEILPNLPYNFRNEHGFIWLFCGINLAFRDDTPQAGISLNQPHKQAVNFV
jgi:hypothetical protein